MERPGRYRSLMPKSEAREPLRSIAGLREPGILRPHSAEASTCGESCLCSDPGPRGSLVGRLNVAAPPLCLPSRAECKTA